MSNNFGSLDKHAVISKEIVAAFEDALIPLSAFTTDFSDEVANEGYSVTTHLYGNETLNAIQDISSTNEINYTNTKTDVALTAKTIVLGRFASDGFDIPELVLSRSTAKDVVQKFGQKKVWQMAKAIMTDVFTATVSGNFNNLTVGCGAAYDINDHMAVVEKALDLDWAPKQCTVVLGNDYYTGFIASLTNLAGVDVTQKALINGSIDGEMVGGVKVIRSTLLPAGVKGFAAAPEAMAVAIRPLPNLMNGESYGTSVTAKTENGLAIRSRRWQDPSTGLISVRFDAVYGYTPCNPNGLITLVV